VYNPFAQMLACLSNEHPTSGSSRARPAERNIPMKKIVLALFVFAAAAFAQSPFDGTWVSDQAAAQFDKKPHTYVLNKGMYTCSTCVPKISVKADGKDQAVSGSNYFNTVAIREVDANTTEEVDKKDGKPMYKDVMTASADGKTLTDKWEDNSEEKPVTGETIYSRISKGPAGSHATSGSWRMEKIQNITSNGLTVTFQSMPDGLKFSDTNGASYEAKFDGKDYPLKGDPGNTMVSLKKISDHTIEETDKRNGKVVNVGHMTVSADGKKMTYVGHDKERDRTSTFVLNKK